MVELASSDGSSLQVFSQQSTGSYSNLLFNDPPLSAAETCEDRPTAAKKKRGTINIINERMTAVLDKCKLSNREATHLIAAVL